MIAVLQRMEKSQVYADGEFSGAAEKGLFILLGVTQGDDEQDALLLAEKISKLRIFSDENDKMNLSVKDIDGEVLVVSNFTLNANYSHGNRPEFFNAAKPAEANALYEKFVQLMRERVRHVGTGVFGASMRISADLCGPVTIVMDSQVLRKGKS